MKSVRESAGMRLAVLFGSFFILLLVSSLLSAIVYKLPVGDARAHALIVSALQCVVAFCIPAFLVAKFSSRNWREWLKLTKVPKLKSLFGVVLVYCFSLPAMEWLIEWNAGLHLPESMAGLEETLRQWETNAADATKTLLDAHGYLSIAIGVIVIGVLTGFSEELFFRGGVQGIFMRTPVRQDLAIWLAAILFSVMHFQFFGFIPRLLMGVFFGYLLVWSRSIWVPVFAHALNNSVVVIVAALTETSGDKILNENATYMFWSNTAGVITSVVLTALVLIWGRDLFKSNKSTEEWQKSQLPPVTGK